MKEMAEYVSCFASACFYHHSFHSKQMFATLAKGKDTSNRKS